MKKLKFLVGIVCLFVPGRSFAQRELFVPPIDASQTYDYRFKADGSAMASTDRVGAGMELTLLLQNVSNVMQTGSVSLDAIRANFGPRDAALVYYPGKVVVSAEAVPAGAGPSCVTTGERLSASGQLSDLKVDWKLPANTPTNKQNAIIRIRFYGWAYGTNAGTGPNVVGAPSNFNRAPFSLKANMFVTVNEDRGAILATYTSNIFDGGASYCGTPIAVNTWGDVISRGGSGLTLLLNGGRPF